MASLTPSKDDDVMAPHTPGPWKYIAAEPVCLVDSLTVVWPAFEHRTTPQRTCSCECRVVSGDKTMRERLVRLRCWQFTRGITEDGGDPSCDDCRAKQWCQRVGEFPWWMLNATDELLAALAEPTEAMVRAGAGSHDHWAGTGTIGADNATRNVRSIWLTMIAEASK